MFYTHHDGLTQGYRTIKQAAEVAVSHGDTDGTPIFRKVKTRPEPYDAEIAAIVRTDGDGKPYYIRIDRNGYDILSSWTTI